MASVSEQTAGYLAELYEPGCTRERLKADAERIRVAVEALAAAGEPIRYVDSLLLPDEGTALHLLEARGPEAVARALADAGLEAERISRAIAPSGAPGGFAGTRDGGRPAARGRTLEP